MNYSRNDTMNTHEKGDWGEDLAVKYLLSNGYSVVCRKYRSRRGEIDCVAKDPDGTLVFLEVKSARTSKYGNPLTWVTIPKQKTMAKVAMQYMKEHKLSQTPCRFDVIGIVGEKIDHIKNAFMVNWF